MTVENTPGSSDAVVKGIPGGDCECFCIHVTESEYRAVCGEKAWKREWELVESDAQDYEEIGDPEGAAKIREAGPTWRIYPNDLIADKFNGKYCRVRVHVEFVKHQGETIDAEKLADLPKGL